MPSGVPKNDLRRAQDDPKRAQESPRQLKTGPRAPQDGPKRSPRGSKKRTQTTRQKKANEVDPRLGLAKGRIRPLSPHPLGGIWAPQNDPKRNQKRSKIEAKNQESKKPIQDDLGSVLRRSWAVLGAILGPWKRSGTTPADVS